MTNSTTKKAPQAAYRFAGNSVGLHTRISITVRRIELLDPMSPETPVRVTATIGESETDTRFITFDLTYREALAADIIERVE